MQGNDWRGILTTEGCYHLGKSLGNIFPSLPQPSCLDFFFPFHYSPFDLSNPLPSFLNAPCPLPFSPLSSETQVPQIQVSEWMTCNLRGHSERVIALCDGVMPQPLTKPRCACTHTHRHTVRTIPIRYCSGMKIEKGMFSGQLRFLEQLAVKSTILPQGCWCSRMICRKSHCKDAFSDVGITL